MSRTKERNTLASPSCDLVKATKSGDRLKTLIVLRNLIAERLQKSGARETASLSIRLMQVLNEIEELQRKSEKDEISKLREKFKVI